METLDLILLDSLDLEGHKPGAPLLVLEGGSPAQKVQMCDLEKHELLLHGLVRGSVEHSMTEQSFHRRIDAHRPWKKCQARRDQCRLASLRSNEDEDAV